MNFSLARGTQFLEITYFKNFTTFFQTRNFHNLFQALTLLVSLLSLHVLSLPTPDGVVGHGGHGGDVYDERPDPFHFEYGVHDDKYHTDFSEQRSGDESGSMKGEYTVALPDGRVQHVIYHADGGYGGTIMEVKYSGEAHHPDYHAGGHGGHV